MSLAATVREGIGREREIRVFQHFDAHLYGNDTGDSAYYDPRSQAIVHYKGRRYFLISGSSGAQQRTSQTVVSTPSSSATGVV